MKKYWLAMAVVFILLLTGCNVKKENQMRNLEERDFATVLMLEKGEEKNYHITLGIAREKIQGEQMEGEEIYTFDCDSLEDLQDYYEKIRGKTLSLAHLKVILLTNICPLEKSCNCFAEFRDHKEIAKTVPVLEVAMPEELLGYMKNIDGSFGTYINDLVRANEREGRNIPWLKDYIKAMQEGDAVMVYEIRMAEEGLELMGKNRG